MRRSALPLVVALAVACPVGAAPADDEFFEKQVRPLLVERCQGCHGEKKPKGGLRLLSRAHVLKGGDSGPAAVAGKPADSLLVQAVRNTDALRMPPKQKLSDKEIAVLTRWVELGLPWPEGRATTGDGGKFVITDEQRRFWSFQPVKDVRPPAVKDTKWPRADLDGFILAALEARGLRPTKAADKRTLLRRATFDLTGLPPTPAEIDAFLKDESADAFARVVDRLLASPAYGERWGRHWVDLVRYADSFDARGLGGEGDISEAWRYRDWVVNAFNRDLPYDQFILDQLAGDVAHGRPNADRDAVIATGMLAIGNWGGGDADKEKLLTDIADDQVDVVSRTFLGLTVACARCHDHKFDPISTADYYGLAGIFFSTHILPNVGPKTNGPPMLRIPLATPAEKAERERLLALLAGKDKELKAARQKAYQDHARAQLAQTARYLLAAHDYQHRPADQAKLSVEAFAEKQGLSGPALRRWLDQVGGGEYRLMSKPVRDVAGKKGVHGWRGAPDCPSLIANTTDKEVAILTFKLPPKSVAVHPGPNNGVAVAWRSPVAGTVKVRGGVTDADPAGGDGIAWAIDLHRDGSRRELASGDFPNGGAQRFDKGKGAGNLGRVEVKAGDRLELVVLPKKDYICDTTVVEFVIALDDGSKVWDLTRDLLGDVTQANPHRDRQGNDGVWHFLDMADAHRGGTADPALAAWQQASTKNDRRALKADGTPMTWSDFSVGQVATSGLFAAASVPAFITMPWVAVPWATGLGVASGAGEAFRGNFGTALFDLSMAGLPWTSKTVRTAVADKSTLPGAYAKLHPNQPARNITGMTTAQAMALERILLRIPGVKQVRAFGSRTRGTSTDTSDLDIALFPKMDKSNPRAVTAAVQRAQEFARNIGIMPDEGRPPLDIHDWKSLSEMWRSFVRDPNFDPDEGLPDVHEMR